MRQKVAEGAQRAGRDPSAVPFALYIRVCVDDDEDAARRARISLSDPWDFGFLAEMVEAWGFRMMQERGSFADRGEVARRWFDDEYAPVSEMLRSGDLIERGETDAEAYMRVAGQRYLLLRTHEWSDDVLDRLRRTDKRKQRRRLPPPRRRRRRI